MSRLPGSDLAASAPGLFGVTHSRLAYYLHYISRIRYLLIQPQHDHNCLRSDLFHHILLPYNLLLSRLGPPAQTRIRRKERSRPPLRGRATALAAQHVAIQSVQSDGTWHATAADPEPHAEPATRLLAAVLPAVSRCSVAYFHRHSPRQKAATVPRTTISRIFALLFVSLCPFTVCHFAPRPVLCPQPTGISCYGYTTAGPALSPTSTLPASQ